jgi:hypothetical protein
VWVELLVRLWQHIHKTGGRVCKCIYVFVKEKCSCSIDSVVFTVTLFWDVTVYCLLDRNQHFEGTCSLHLQVITLFLCEGGCSRFLQNIGPDLPNMPSHHKPVVLMLSAYRTSNLSKFCLLKGYFPSTSNRKCLQ